MSARNSSASKNSRSDCGFPFVKRVETFDFSYQPSLDRKQIPTLATCHFIEHGENVVLHGPPGGTSSSGFVSKPWSAAIECC